MRYINSSDNVENVDKKDIVEINLNKVGRPVEKDSELIFAKSMFTQSENGISNKKYAILVLNNQPYDPYGVDSHRESKLRLELKNVNYGTYSYYVSYLKTKNSLYMTRSQRSFING
jgi:hypothetical protein